MDVSVSISDRVRTVKVRITAKARLSDEGERAFTAAAISAYEGDPPIKRNRLPKAASVPSAATWEFK